MAHRAAMLLFVFSEQSKNHHETTYNSGLRALIRHHPPDILFRPDILYLIRYL
jgi:hypothetical protein